MGQYWKQIKEKGDISALVFDRVDQEMNILSAKVLMELSEHLDKIANDTSVKGLVFISDKPDQFIVGADINEIASMQTPEAAAEGAAKMQAVFQKIHSLKIPTVAAINGPCLGGGLELSLACSWRVVTDEEKTKLALPEIQLGLIPGAGGTQRLPRLIGIQAALDMILTGKRIGGAKATKMGLADACVPKGQLLEQALRFASKKRGAHKGGLEVKSGGLSQDIPRWATEGNMLGRKIMARKAREMVDDKTKGFYPASYKALDAVFDGFETSLERGLALEAKLFGQLAVTREAKSLIHLFHATTAIKKHPYKEAGKERFKGEKPRLLGVVGAGFMGAGVATVAAERGYRVRLSDPSKDSVGRALKHVRDYFKKQAERKRIKRFEVDKKVAHISPGLSPLGFNQCDVVIEAVYEDLSLKQKILKGMEEGIHENWIFASNTSALPIQEIAKVSKYPERILGMHFFSPVEKMPLLEIVVTPKTADWVTARAIEIGQDMGKQVIVVKDSPGFYTTRALGFFLAEASNLLIAGMSIEELDKALTEFGFPVGPITLIDEVGIDVGLHVLETLAKAFPERIQIPAGFKAVTESGRLGRKNKKGFYLYDEEGKKGGVDPSIYDIVGVKPKSNALPLDEVIDRCLLTFVNESALCLDEGILRTPFDGDVGAVFGLGFPPFWGGPFKYVDHIGAKNIVDRLNGLSDKYGASFKPAKVLVEHAKSNKRFFPEEP